DIFDTLIVGSKTSTGAIRRPRDNAPVHDVNSDKIRCNQDLIAATEVVSVTAGSRVGFSLDTGTAKTVFHQGPAAMYLGKAPGDVRKWDGSGASWFKIAHWGAVFQPKFTFIAFAEKEFYADIPASVPSGEYLLRIEHVGLHLTGQPEFFISCAQIKITSGGTGTPSYVSIPGYVSKTDPGLMVDIYWPVPTSYTVSLQDPTLCKKLTSRRYLDQPHTEVKLRRAA
ncbi:hypothetical protein FA15DRAFT_721389, partial [Coprinopsis marcescibilis]